MASLFDQAWEARDEGNSKKAFRLFYKAVQQGDSGCYLNLGYCYDEGIGTEKNVRKAIYWYKRAGKNGNSSGYNNIAVYYASIGKFEQAKRWYLRAFKKGNKSVALNLAKLGIDGKVNFPREKILRYLQIVIDAECMVEVCEADQEEAELLLAKLSEQ